MTTKYTSLGLTEPVKFLGATVLSFNTTLGLGSQPSNLTVQLIEDCQNIPPDAFELNLLDNNPNKKIVGDPILFTAGSFTFGGIITSWNVKLNSSGKTFEVKIDDPRQLLQNTSIIIDNYNGQPKIAANYANTYFHLEENLCEKFGLSFNTEEGAPYLMIMQALTEIQYEQGPFICSPTCSDLGKSFKVDFSTFPGGVNSPYQNFPFYYRLQGPSVPLLEILTQAAEMSGFEFYTYLDFPVNDLPTIRVGLIDLKNTTNNFGQIQTFIDSFVGGATDLSYGQELRNEITKTMFIGEKVHYLTETRSFWPFFGEEVQNGVKTIVVPYGWDDFGFWIKKSTETLDLTLNNPLNGIYQLSELDIRFAMASFKSWLFWVFISQANGSFNDIVRNKFPLVNVTNYTQLIAAMAGDPSAMSAFGHWIDNTTNRSNGSRLAPDAVNAPNRTTQEANKPEVIEELEKIHKWLADLGNTYYGKKYLCALNEGICYYLTTYPMIDGDGNAVFSSNPTSSAWVDPGTPVLQLNDPFLEVFRDDTGKIGGFAAFKADGQLDQNGGIINTTPNYGIPTPGGPAGGAGLAGFCWVAREIYGDYDIRWIIFRHWITTKASPLFYYIYKTYGERFAKFIKYKPYLKTIIKYFMDKIIYKYLKGNL